MTVTGVHVRASRLWLSAFCSALVTTVFPPSLWSSSLGFLCLLGIAFFGQRSMLLVQACWLLVGTVIVGGFLTMLQPLFFQQSPVLALTCFVFLASCFVLLLSTGWQRKLLSAAQQRYVTTCALVLEDMALTVQAYIDTGNECRELLSRAPVHFLSLPDVEGQLPASFRAALQQWQQAESTNLTMFAEAIRPSIRLIRVVTVHKEPQLVLGFRVSQLLVDERAYTGHYVVFTQNEAPFPQHASMILHVCILLTK